jgi:hypothetical protein
MRHLVSLIFALFLTTGVKCQYRDSVMLTNYPVRYGMAYQFDYTNSGGCNLGADTWVFVKSKSDSVFQTENGVVTGVYNLGADEMCVAVRQAQGLTFIYGNLKFVAFKKGDLLKKGDFVGLMPYNAEEMKYCMDILMYDDKNSLYAGKILLRLRQIDQSGCIISAAGGF